MGNDVRREYRNEPRSFWVSQQESSVDSLSKSHQEQELREKQILESLGAELRQAQQENQQAKQLYKKYTSGPRNSDLRASSYQCNQRCPQSGQISFSARTIEIEDAIKALWRAEEDEEAQRATKTAYIER